MRRFQGAGGFSPDVKGVEWHRAVTQLQCVANHTKEVTSAGAAAVTACTYLGALTAVGSCSQGLQKVGSESSQSWGYKHSSHSTHQHGA